MKEIFIAKTNIIPYTVSPLLERAGCHHLFTTRHGGVSEGMFKSLNFGLRNGDNIDRYEDVCKNFDLAASVFGLTRNNVVRAFQKHTNNVLKVGIDNCSKTFDFGVDGLVTNEKNVLLAIKTADCAPVVFYEKNGKCCGAVHSGWRGTFGDISENAINLMKSEYSIKPKNILVAIGPYICMDCYEVGDELFELFFNKDKKYSDCFKKYNGIYHFDNARAIVHDLIDCGISENNISVCDACTCHDENYFSHRRQGFKRGSLASFVVLK